MKVPSNPIHCIIRCSNINQLPASLLSAGPYNMRVIQACPSAGPSLLTSSPLLCLGPISQHQLYLSTPACTSPSNSCWMLSMMYCRAPHLTDFKVSHVSKMSARSSQIPWRVYVRTCRTCPYMTWLVNTIWQQSFFCQNKTLAHYGRSYWAYDD